MALVEHECISHISLLGQYSLVTRLCLSLSSSSNYLHSYLSHANLTVFVAERDQYPMSWLAHFKCLAATCAKGIQSSAHPQTLNKNLPVIQRVASKSHENLSSL